MSHRHHRPASSRVCLVMALLLSGIAWPDVVRGAEMLQLTLRSRPANSQGSGGPVSESSVQWDPQHTAVIVCDMWDDHWCRGAAERVGELAKPMNRLLENFRQRGALIIHAPSTCVQAYEGTPARLRARPRRRRRRPLRSPRQCVGELAGIGPIQRAKRTCPSTTRTWVAIANKNARFARPGRGRSRRSKSRNKTRSRITPKSSTIC